MWAVIIADGPEGAWFADQRKSWAEASAVAERWCALLGPGAAYVEWDGPRGWDAL